MDPSSFLALAAACAPLVAPATAQAIVAVESGFNPYAIGVVGAALQRQPRTSAEARATLRALRGDGWSYSVGLAQIHRSNLARLGLTPATALDPCRSLAAMQAILLECLARARSSHDSGRHAQHALRRALSCYYSGNFTTGWRHGYVQRVVRTAAAFTTRPDRAATPTEDFR